MSTNLGYQTEWHIYELSQFFDKIAVTPSIDMQGSLRTKYYDYLSFWNNYYAQRGSIIIISMPNSLDMIAMFFAVLNAGYVPAPISQTTPVERINQMIIDFKAVALVKNCVSTSHWNKMNIYDIEPLDNWYVGSCDKYNRTAPLTTSGQVVMVTSGTSSSFSSGCVHDFESLRRNAVRHGESIGLSSSDRMLVTLPLCYSTALVSQMICAMEFSCYLIISGPPFSVKDYLRTLFDFKISVSSLTPILLRQLNLAKDVMPESLKKLLIGGDFLPPDEVEKCLNKNPGLEFYLTYGISEAGPRVSTCPVFCLDKRYYSSVGLPLADTLVRLLKGNGEVQGGELLILSDSLLKKRIGQNVKNPFITIDGQNWLRTGDLFDIDQAGYLFFKGRISDFIILRGEKVNLSAIKTLCRNTEGVLTCKTKVHYENGSATGYDLTLICDEDVIDVAEGKRILELICSKLTHHERPSNIEILSINPNNLNHYK